MASKEQETAARYIPQEHPQSRSIADHGFFNQPRDATPSNPRGIPYAPFVDKVEDYVTSRADVEPTLRRFQEMIALVPTRPGQGFSNERTESD
jgi:hypothetical protein